jgi:hypothetical protein
MNLMGNEMVEWVTLFSFCCVDYLDALCGHQQVTG